MSQENVEIVRRCFDAWRRGDNAEALASLAPDVVWKVAQEAPAHGPDEVRSVWERWEGPTGKSLRRPPRRSSTPENTSS
jgi:ketosteroid isomerase-like protein